VDRSPGDHLTPERSVDSRRQLPDADDFPSPTPELAGDAQRKMSSAVDQIRPASRSRLRNSDGSIIGMP
jgi:hypothetical protein